MDASKRIFIDIATERVRQDKKWGVQDHPDLCPLDLSTFEREGYGDTGIFFAGLEIPTEEAAKFICRSGFQYERGNWAAIVSEELSESVEAAAQKDPVALREELIQLAAVVIAWVEALDRRE